MDALLPQGGGGKRAGRKERWQAGRRCHAGKEGWRADAPEKQCGDSELPVSSWILNVQGQFDAAEPPADPAGVHLPRQAWCTGWWC